jgi:hypothetical protein
MYKLGELILVSWIVILLYTTRDVYAGKVHAYCGTLKDSYTTYTEGIYVHSNPHDLLAPFLKY